MLQLTNTIISQGHLCPIALNALTVHWDFDYCMRLYPLPDLVVIGDKAEMYEGINTKCTIVNPVILCVTSFAFKLYMLFVGSIL